MGIIVQKFGGTSVGTVERIQSVAERVIEEYDRGNEVVVVVSAMGKTTDSLVSLCNGVSGNPPKRELDMLLSTGEQVTIALLSMAIHQKGYEAHSFTGWQAGIGTEKVFGNSRITSIDTKKIHAVLGAKKIAVVAGFQGITEDGEITTLGRGGSDTTAVALASALNADRCDIYTDVDGVYTCDPRFIDRARKLDSISYDEMLELANLGAGVLHPRAVEFAKNYCLPLEVRSSMEQRKGTRIEEEVSMEKSLAVRGVAFEEDIIRLTIFGLSNAVTGLSDIFSTLAHHHIDVDIIIQSQLGDGTMNLSFSIKEKDLSRTLLVLETEKSRLAFERVEFEKALAKVSIVGSGMVSNPGVAAKMFDVLTNEGIGIKMVSTSEIKVSVVVARNQIQAAASALHTAFQLDKSNIPI
ncbi:aspartate kinase [Bacillus sp. 2205SS5-2]|uniref:aspartate kinase n=1 Tax=Bacillus sp. 2205SS5-2 TaxID=3109031 RepID=UPI003007596E